MQAAGYSVTADTDGEALTSGNEPWRLIIWTEAEGVYLGGSNVQDGLPSSGMLMKPGTEYYVETFLPDVRVATITGTATVWVLRTPKS